jgi:hypothetical protein
LPRADILAAATPRRGAGAIDRLQDQFEIERELEFADHHDRRIVAAQRHEVAAADLALDREAELFEEAFDGQIKRGFPRRLRAAVAATQCLVYPDRGSQAWI